MNPRSFFAELKRRNVYKVAIAYAVVAWLLIQAASILLPTFEAPPWVMKVFVMTIAFGFPIALILAWAFELTPEGIKRTEVADSAPRESRGRAWIYVAIVAGALSLGLFFLGRYTASPKQSAAGGVFEKSIAVLPFENKSRDAAMEYLSDGIAEALINSLTTIRELKVMAQTTAFRYKGKEIDPQAIGRELKVGSLLMGSVRSAGDNLVVQVDLVDTSNGAQLWGEEFERKLVELVSVKQTIARAVTDKLRLRLTGAEKQQLVSRDSSNPKAYQLYLRGRLNLATRSAQGIQTALEQFQEAVRLDPKYAAAYSGMADCYLLLEQYAGTPATEILPLAKAAADKALQIDNSLGEAHTSLAAYYHGMWQWDLAEKEYQRAIQLNPNYPTAHHWYQLTLRTTGRLDQAMTEIRRAQELDPFASIFVVNSAAILLMKGDIDGALRESERLIAINPTYALAYEPLGKIYIKQQKYNEAVHAFERDVAIDRTSFSIGSLGHAYALAGRREEAMRVLSELQERYAKRGALGQYIACVYAGLGDMDQAFAWLEKDFQVRSGFLDYVITNPLFDFIRSDPRYADLLRRMGLKP